MKTVIILTILSNVIMLEKLKIWKSLLEHVDFNKTFVLSFWILFEFQVKSTGCSISFYHLSYTHKTRKGKEKMWRTLYKNDEVINKIQTLNK